MRVHSSNENVPSIEVVQSCMGSVSCERKRKSTKFQSIQSLFSLKKKCLFEKIKDEKVEIGLETVTTRIDGLK